MSLPPATQDVSEHPGKGSVTVPVDRSDKDRDVRRKIRLYGAVEAFRKGRLPTNKQADEALIYARDHSPVDIDMLSDEGKSLVNDVRGIIDTVRAMLDEKNADELLQNFIWDTRDIDRENLRPGEVARPVDREALKSESQQAVQHLRTLFHIVLTNSEARKLLSDFSVIGRDLLSKSAAKAAETIAPSEDDLRHVDEAAPEGEFITEGGRRVGPNETPVLEAPLPGTDKTVRRDPKEGETVMQSGEEPPRAVSDVVREGQGRAKDLTGEGEKVKEEVVQAGEDVAKQPGRQKATSAQAKKSGFMGKIKSLSQRIPPEQKETGRGQYERGKRHTREQVDRGKHFLADEYFPEERRRQFIYRGKKVIIECQKHEDYQESIRWLLDYIKHYVKHGRTIAGHGQTAAEDVFHDSKVDLGLRQLRTLLERFANNTSLVDVINATNVLIDTSRHDPALRTWFNSVNSYIRRVLLESGYVLEDESTTRARELREDGRRFFDEKYRGEFDDLFRAVSDWFSAMAQDPLNKRFGEAWARLTKDLLFTPSGTLTFKSDLWADIRRTILPDLTRKLGYIPIPRIEYTDPDVDLVIENLALQGRNILPNIVSIEASNFVKFSPYNAIRDEGSHEIQVHLEQMQADMRDVAFYYRTKSGLVKIRDSGLADVLIGGRGIMATIVLHTPPSRARARDEEGDATPASLFEVKSIHTKVDSLKFSIRNSKHDFLYKTIKPLATGLIKRQIQRAIRDLLMNGMEYLDTQLVSMKEKMEVTEAGEGEGGKTRTEALRSMFQKRKEETATQRRRAAETQAEAERKKPRQFKIVNNLQDSLLAGEGHPAGWVRLTEERDRAAVTGREWRSEAFDIVHKEREERRLATEEERPRERAPGERTVYGPSTSTAAAQAQAPPPVQLPAPALADGRPVGTGTTEGFTPSTTGYVEPSTGTEGVKERLAANANGSATHEGRRPHRGFN